MRSFVSRQLRSIARRPAHLTKQTNTEVRQLLGMREVMATLEHEVEQMASKVNEIHQDDPMDIRAAEITRRQLHRLVTGFSTAPEVPHTKEDTMPQVTCPERCLNFPSVNQMRQHRAQTKKIRVHPTHTHTHTHTTVFNAAVHAMNGLPQCVGCQHWLACPQRPCTG